MSLHKFLKLLPRKILLFFLESIDNFLILRTKLQLLINSKTVWPEHMTKVNLGSSSTQILNGFVNIDILNLNLNSNLNYVGGYDLTLGFDFCDNSLDEIYASHFLEHLEIEKISFIIDECYRTLKPGGYFRVVLPDQMKSIGLFIHDPNKLSSWFESHSKFNEIASAIRRLDPMNLQPIDFLNFALYDVGGSRGHKICFEEDSFVNFVKAKGFSNFSLTKFSNKYDRPIQENFSVYFHGNKDDR
jgi:predicted SAM-dependent methyltransferase